MKILVHCGCQLYLKNPRESAITLTFSYFKSFFINLLLLHSSPSFLLHPSLPVPPVIHPTPSPPEPGIVSDSRLALESLLYPVQGTDLPHGHHSSGALASLLHSNREHVTSVYSIKDDAPYLLCKVYLPALSTPKLFFWSLL